MIDTKVEDLLSTIFSLRRLIVEEHRCGCQRDNTMTWLQLEALRHIQTEEDIPMKKVADFFHITPPSATALVDNLAKAGMIKRIPDKKDRRLTKLIITTKGKNFLEKGQKEIFIKVKKVLSCLTENEQDQMLKIYQKIINIFNQNIIKGL